jgi:tRNA (guanine-N7-)-methyltransferase
MSRSLRYDIPGDDPRLLLVDVLASGWDAAFAKARGEGEAPGDVRGGRRPRVLEIGFGRGEFLLDLAVQSPEVDFVGIEVSYKRTLKMARKVARAGLRNVRLLEARAQVVLPRLFAPGSLETVWLNFSDPWPKKRHAHRRLVQPAFVADVARVLASGGLFQVATDDVRYAAQIDAILRAEPALVNHYAPWPYLAEVPGRRRTGYEAQWRAADRPLHFFAYAARPRPETS